MIDTTVWAINESRVLCVDPLKPPDRQTRHSLIAHSTGDDWTMTAQELLDAIEHIALPRMLLELEAKGRATARRSV